VYGERLVTFDCDCRRTRTTSKGVTAKNQRHVLGPVISDRSSPSSPVKIFPAVADIIRCPTEILSVGGGGDGTGSVPVPAVDAMVATVSGSSKCDVHDAPAEELISVPHALSGAPEWLEVERSSPIDIQSAVTDCETN
jgi:hypothetical protein